MRWSRLLVLTAAEEEEDCPTGYDLCGVCGGTNECVDCAGVPFGTSEIDECGVCILDGENNPEWNKSCADCNGVPNGDAYINECGICVGGETN